MGDLLEEISLIRERGWAMSVDYPLPNRANLAVALPKMPDQPPMTLCIGSQKPTMLAKQDVFLAEFRASCATVTSCR